jgi:hypothetical protein
MHRSKVFDHSFGPAFDRRLDQWRAGGPELTEAEAARYVREADPDLITTNNYIMDQLTPEEERDFEARLVNDPAFFEKVWPMVDAAAAMRHQSAADRVAIPIARGNRRRSMPWRVVGYAAAAVASMLIVAGPLEVLHLSRAYETAASRREKRADVGSSFFRTGFSTGPRETRREALRAGQLTVRPNSRYTISPLQGRDVKLRTLDGSALVSIIGTDPRDAVNIRTATAFVAFERGYFEITSVPGSGVTTVVVYEGRADVRPLEPTRPLTSVTARHRAIIGRNGSVAVDSIGAMPAPPKDWLTLIRGG